MQDLDKFKNEMNLSGKNVYVGHRYVPKIFGEWDNTKIYEPLSIVQYQGNSFTSRQYVPIGVELTNEEFWASTGNYNAQVEQYRQDVRNLENDVDNFTDEVTNARDGETSLKDRLDKDHQEVTTELAQKENYVNYKMFGLDGAPKYYNPQNGRYYTDSNLTQEYTLDDGLKIKAAHDYANENGLDVYNPSGHYVIRNTRNISVKTNINLGKSVFHIKEGETPTQNGQLFSVYSDYPEQVITGSLLQTILPQLKKGVSNIPELSPYADSMVVVADRTKAIYRNGDKTTNGGGHEDFFYVGQDGRIIGNLLWTYDNLTEIRIRKCNETYINIEGGQFLLSGDLKPSVLPTEVKRNGFHIERSRVVIENQVVGFEKDVTDGATIPSMGFHFLTYGYDVTVKNIKTIARKLAGSYAIGGRNLLNFRFENITSGGDSHAFGSVGTNYLHNGVISHCHFNRFDVHLSAMDLTIENSVIGKQGISLMGGGELNIENTSVDRFIFLELRGDYGAHWDGNITIKNCKLFGDLLSEDHQIILHHQNGEEFGFPLVFGQNIKVENFTFDYTALPTQDKAAHLINYRNPVTPTKYLYNDKLITLPENIEMKNIHVIGRTKGVKLFNLRYPHLYQTGKLNSRTVTRNHVSLKTNANYQFENIDVDKLVDYPQSLESVFYFLNNASETYTPQSLVPKMIIRDCIDLTILIGSSVLELNVENSTISTLDAFDGGDGKSLIKLSNCEFKPEILIDANNPFLFLYNDVRITNCKVHPTNNNVASSKAFIIQTGEGIRLINANYQGLIPTLPLINYLKTITTDEEVNRILTILSGHIVNTDLQYIVP